ncbi:MAG: SDR family NAD(P)-dependent oxidoreductase [Acidimicrobiales bacterium]
MESVKGKIAVVTGGGPGMGRAWVRQLAAEGCAVATCDLNAEAVEETAKLAISGAPASTRVTHHVCDVADEAQVDRFRDEVVSQHETTFVNLVFNNAGIGGGGSFVTGSREEWEKTFAVCWTGVYNCSRAFVPLLVAGPEGYLINTSSVNGFWASLGPGVPHTSYSAAKFAVKGFSEALLEDFRVHAPHVKVAVVMPGHIGTDIIANTRRALGQPQPDEMTEAQLETAKADLVSRGMPVGEATLDDVRKLLQQMWDGFRNNAPMTSEEAATVILNGVRTGAWRILVGADAVALDEQVRADPERAYGMNLHETLGALRQSINADADQS